MKLILQVDQYIVVILKDKQISEWQKTHPEYNDPDSKQNDKYMNIVLNSMSGSTKEESNKNYEKIARNIAKETIINK